jgi:hypothetical protein
MLDRGAHMCHDLDTFLNLEGHCSFSVSCMQGCQTYNDHVGSSAVQLCHKATRGAATQYCCATGLQGGWQRQHYCGTVYRAASKVGGSADTAV